MRITIVGSGDAFGSGGRLNMCFHAAASQLTQIRLIVGGAAYDGFRVAP